LCLRPQPEKNPDVGAVKEENSLEAMADLDSAADIKVTGPAVSSSRATLATVDFPSSLQAGQDRSMDQVSESSGIAPASVVPPAYISAATRQILGINFFSGGASEAVQRMRDGGLLVAPAAPGLSRLTIDHAYRDALLEADVAIVDSALMALVWNLLEGDDVGRLSGLEYFSQLVNDPEFRRPGAALFVMASDKSARRNVAWLQSEGIPVDPTHVYIAPMYGNEVVDPELLELVSKFRPRHVVITVGGGTQERLGLFIKKSVDYRPAIHCIGAAIAFRSGDQVYIPPIADRLAMGWFLRCLWRPRSYVPRYWEARKLAWLLYRYRAELPPPLAYSESNATESSASVA
jgi:UDP-N-acetyl-D-mannosaminuronic acid transferase (WecB/TagA/CpsF family)